MAGYTRQSVADILNGLDITAPPLNAEFNQLANAFDGSVGHGHTGGIGDGPPIDLSTAVTGYLQAENGGGGGRNNITATTNPTVNDDAADGYAPLSLWLNTVDGTVFLCVGNALGAASWRRLGQLTDGEAFAPLSNNTTDLGTTALRFRTLYLSLNAYVGGAMNVTGLATLGNLSVTGTADFTNTRLLNVSTPTGANDAANKSYVDAAISALVAAAPGTLDTLNELAAAIGDDPNYATTMTNALASKLNLSGGTMTGVLTMGGNKITGLGSPTVGSDAVTLTYLNTLFGSTSSAATSASNAASSASAAATSASQASGFADDAEGFAEDAQIAANSVTKQTSPTDATAGRLMAVGAFGLGSTSPTILSNINSYSLAAGFYTASSASTTGTLPPGNTTHDVVLVMRPSSNQTTQIYSIPNDGKTYIRKSNSNTSWGAWKEVVTAGTYGLGGDTTPQITSFTSEIEAGFYNYNESTATGLPTSEAYSGWAIVNRTNTGATTFLICRQTTNLSNQRIWLGVRGGSTGTVTWQQVLHAGMINGSISLDGSGYLNPTSSIFERGANSNGAYVKFLDGTMICTHRLSMSADAPEPWTFPVTFQSAPRMYATAGTTSVFRVATADASSASAGAFRIWTDAVAWSGTPANLLAIGRWY